jgi:hypothetical protein
VLTPATDEFFPNLSGTFGNRRVVGNGPASLGATMHDGSSIGVERKNPRESRASHLNQRLEKPMASVIVLKDYIRVVSGMSAQ